MSGESAQRGAHVASVYGTAMGYRWGCSCGREGRGVGTPTPAGAWAAANRHVFTALKKARITSPRDSR